MNLPRTSWKQRRRTMFAVLIFCMAVIGWIVATAQDGATAETVITMAFSIIGLVVSVYVFGATVEDIQRTKLIANGGGE